MDAKEQMAETSKKYCSIQITTKVADVGTEQTIAKIADMYKTLYNRANNTLDVSRTDPSEIAHILEELNKNKIKAKPIESVMLENLHERMDTLLGKESTESQSVSQKDEDEPLPPATVQENLFSDPFEGYDPYELLIGATVELEHTDSTMEALKIAIQHLSEVPDYYSKLLTFVEPDFDPTDKLKEEEVPQDEEVENQPQRVHETEAIDVGRMIKNMSKVHIPKFDSKRNLAGKFKSLFKMPSPKDDMNAASQNRESYAVVGEFIEEGEADKILNSLLNKKRNAHKITKDGKQIIIVEESLKEDNTMSNSQDVMGTKISKKIDYASVKKNVKQEGEDDEDN